MDVQKKLDEIVTAVSGARSMPMSASCVINRAELLALLEEVRAALPGSLAQAREVIGDREQLVAGAHEEAERILAAARAERASMISGTEVARLSADEAERILADARREAAAIRAEADDYVDSQLANFEVVLTKTLGSIDRGREKLLGLRGDGTYDDAYGEEDDAPGRSTDPGTQRHSADAYVDAKLGAVSAVLAKTLESVGRGREKLQGVRPTDELGALASDGTPGAAHTSDADFLAELAASQEPSAHPGIPQQTGWPEPVAAQHPDVRHPDAPHTTVTHATGDYAVHDPYGYQQQHYAPQTDPYAVQGYQQADPYGWAPQGGHHAPQEPQGVPQQGYGGGGALDETSLFDTSMIDLDQLRRYEQGR
ncbi:cell division initiation protein [Streptomyces sp. NPDC049577]|uniref:cell division initiation protein n=1 Tax=Streptomyces sp. NPDC049577 TaxID=3155153 RepID=UPI00341D5C6F